MAPKGLPRVIGFSGSWGLFDIKKLLVRRIHGMLPRGATIGLENFGSQAMKILSYVSWVLFLFSLSFALGDMLLPPNRCPGCFNSSGMIIGTLAVLAFVIQLLLGRYGQGPVDCVQGGSRRVGHSGFVGT